MKKNILSLMLAMVAVFTPLTAQAQGQSVQDKWALVVGLSQFQNPSIQLKSGAKDAVDFYNYLVNEAGFKRDHICLLLNKDATRGKIMNAFASKFLPAVTRTGDMVVVYVASRGTPPSEDAGKRSFVMAYDSDPEDLYSSGLDMGEFSERLVSGVQSDKTLVVLNTDFSGNGIPKSRGGAPVFAPAQGHSAGHLVITSCAADEKSTDSTGSQNSLFTKCFLQALRKSNGKVDLQTAFEETKTNVSAQAKSSSSKGQVPQIGGQWQGDFVLAAPTSAPRQVLVVPFSSQIEAGAK